MDDHCGRLYLLSPTSCRMPLYEYYLITQDKFFMDDHWTERVKVDEEKEEKRRDVIVDGEKSGKQFFFF